MLHFRKSAKIMQDEQTNYTKLHSSDHDIAQNATFLQSIRFSNIL